MQHLCTTTRKLASCRYAQARLSIVCGRYLILKSHGPTVVASLGFAASSWTLVGEVGRRAHQRRSAAAAPSRRAWLRMLGGNYT